ncbi:MAG: hypothetical protein R3D30_09990 [Hyphomicrobiales bacterium]
MPVRHANASSIQRMAGQGRIAEVTQRVGEILSIADRLKAMTGR